MNKTRDLLERVGERFTFPDDMLKRIERRRDRKRRNQRLAAGVVGIAVFVAAVWIVTSVSSLDRSETSVVPGGDVTGTVETGPVETVPVETGPTVTGPVLRNPGDPYSVGFRGLPPEGATPSKPLRGELVMEDSDSNPVHWYAVTLFADGRLIWSREDGPGRQARWIEQRLTPEGVELLRSGAVPLGGEGYENPAQGLPASAWEDRTFRPFVPWRYQACLTGEPSSQTPDFLPAEAKDVLRRGPWMHGCRGVTLEDARVLVEILRDAGFELRDGDLGGVWMFTNQTPNKEPPGIALHAALPDGSYYLVGF